MGTAEPHYREVCVRGTKDFPLSLYHFVRKNKVVTSHWHPEIEILYMIDGEMILYVSEEKHILKAGDICFVNPGELHGLDAREKGADYYATVFFPSLFQFQEKHFLEQEFISPLVEGVLQFPRLIRKGQKEYDVIQSIVHRMFGEDESSKVRIYTDLTVLFCELMEHGMMQNMVESRALRYTDTIKRCIRYMELNYPKKMTLLQLAEEVHMSQNYFCSYFKKYTGVSPFTQLHYIRVKSAEQMLVQRDDSIVAVAEACGFENVSFFIRKFKEITGYTPSAYRKQMRASAENSLL